MPAFVLKTRARAAREPEMRKFFFIQGSAFFSTCLLKVSASASDNLVMDKTEVSIGAFAIFAQQTGFVSQAERHGGMVYELGWGQSPAGIGENPMG